MQRLWDGPTRHRSGRVIIIVVGFACAIFHLGCVQSGIAVLRGAQHDPVARRLVGDAAVAYLDVRPLIVLFMALLGIAHVAVAWQAWRGRIQTFFVAWSMGTAVAVLLVGTIVIFAQSTEGAALQLIGLVVQAGATLWLIFPNLPEPSGTINEDRKVMR